jgi:hypothetical protein
MKHIVPLILNRGKKSEFSLKFHQYVVEFMTSMIRIKTSSVSIFLKKREIIVRRNNIKMNVGNKFMYPINHF